MSRDITWNSPERAEIGDAAAIKQQLLEAVSTAERDKARLVVRSERLAQFDSTFMQLLIALKVECGNRSVPLEIIPSGALGNAPAKYGCGLNCDVCEHCTRETEGGKHGAGQIH